ncbi:MAG TPA: hypothetical protein PLE78_13370 [Flavobacteriales bacterium]|nr:hypothetical protein [Flavobacteriales bacterium]
MLATCTILPQFAQDTKAVHQDYDWGGAAVWEPSWDSISAGTEVLNDQLSIRIKNTKAQNLSLFFERRQVIRFASDADILEHGRFLLPESLDPAFDAQLAPFDQRIGDPLPLWFNVRLDHFAARIIRANGTWGEIGVFSAVHREEVRTPRSMETAWSYALDLQSISTGDVVEIRWKYMVPYNNYWEGSSGWRGFQWMDNWARLTSWRVFFHGDLPIRDQTVSIAYHLKHGLVLGGTPPNNKKEDGDNVVVSWSNTTLPGCTNEVNARLAEDLPFVTVRLAPEDTRYFARDRYSGIAHQQTYWMYVLRTREAKAFFWKQVAHKRVPDHQNKLFNDFVDAFTVRDPNLEKARLMERMHEEIATNFTYDDDLDWFNDMDHGLPRMGDQVHEKRLRNISRYDIYAKLANAIDAPYSTAYLLDKRVGTLNDHWLTPLWANEFLFGVSDEEDVSWMHPKCSLSGTLANELPFYWQGAPALVMDLEHLAMDYPDPPLFVDLPVSDANGNVRGIEYEVDVDGTQSVGSVRVFLSGQFSTLGRGSYAELPMDGSVNSLYGSVAFDRDGIVPRVKTASHLDTDPPFRFRTSADVDLPALVTTGNGELFSVDLSRFFAHVVPKDFFAAERDLPFYWDFPQDDRLIIELHFKGPVNVLNAEDLERSASTPNASIERSVTQLSPHNIRVESRLRVIAEREEVSDAVQLEELLRVAMAEGLHLELQPEEPQP